MFPRLRQRLASRFNRGRSVRSSCNSSPCRSANKVNGMNSTNCSRGTSTNYMRPQDQTQFSREISGSQGQNQGGNDIAKNIKEAWNSSVNTKPVRQVSHSVPAKMNRSDSNINSVNDAKRSANSGNPGNHANEVKNRITRTRGFINRLRGNRGRMNEENYNQMMQKSNEKLNELEKNDNKISSHNTNDRVNHNQNQGDSGNNTHRTSPERNGNPNPGDRVNGINRENQGSNVVNQADREKSNTANASDGSNRVESSNSNGRDLKDQYKDKVKFTDFQAQKGANPQIGGVLSDIESHLPSKYGGMYRDSDKITWAHETTHGINSHLRNNYNSTPTEQGFYTGNNKAVMIEEPRIKKSSVDRFIPPSLKNGTSQMYVRGQRAFENQPNYILDEWTSYTNGGAAGVDLAKNGQWRGGNRDGVRGQLEFTAYAFSLGMAVEKQDPSYFKNNDQFKNFLGWHGLKAMDGFREGQKVSQFNMGSQDQFLDRFRNSPDAKPLRDFIVRNYGEEYLQRLLYGQ